MSEFGKKWTNLKEWMLHLQRKRLDTPINPDRDNYKEGFADAVDMCIRFMEASEMEGEPKEPYIYQNPISKGAWKKEGL